MRFEPQYPVPEVAKTAPHLALPSTIWMPRSKAKKSHRTRRPLRYWTVTLADPLTPLYVAVIVLVPAATPVVSPCAPLAVLTVATVLADEAHVATAVMSCVVLSL